MLRSSAWVFIAKLMVAVLNFGSVIIISRWLGPADRGVCGWYIVIIALSLVFSDMIAGPAAGYLLKDFSSRAIRLVSYSWALLVSVSTTTVLFFLKKINIAEAIVLTGLCWLNSVNSLHLHLLLAWEKFRTFNFLSLLSPLLGVIFILFFSLFKAPDTFYYLLSLLMAWLICFATGLIAVRNRPETGKPGLKPLLRQGFKNGISNQLSHLAGLLSNRLIYFLLPAAALGVYANALSLAEASLMIPTSLGQVLYAARLNKKTGEKPLETARGSLIISMILMSVILAFVLVVPDDFYVFIFGTAFTGVKTHLWLLSLFMIFYGGYLVCSYWQSANGRFMYNFYGNAAALIVNGGLSLYFYLTATYTIRNGIIALGVGFVAMFVVSLGLIQKSHTNSRATA